MPDLEGRMRRLAQAGAVTVSAAMMSMLVLTGCNSLSAEPSDPRPPNSFSAPTDQATPATSARATRMDRVIDQIYGGREDTDIPGFVGLSVDVETGTIDLHWVGDPPGGSRRSLRQFRLTSPSLCTPRPTTWGDDGGGRRRSR